MVDMLKTHIINNPSLIHLNISRCNLRIKEITILFEAIKKSKSLLSVHLSGNIKHEDVKMLGWNRPKQEKASRVTSLTSKKLSNAKRDKSITPARQRVNHMMQERLDRQKRQSMMLELYKQNQQK